METRTVVNNPLAFSHRVREDLKTQGVLICPSCANNAAKRGELTSAEQGRKMTEGVFFKDNGGMMVFDPNKKDMKVPIEVLLDFGCAQGHGFTYRLNIDEMNKAGFIIEHNRVRSVDNGKAKAKL